MSTPANSKHKTRQTVQDMNSEKVAEKSEEKQENENSAPKTRRQNSLMSYFKKNDGNTITPVKKIKTNEIDDSKVTPKKTDVLPHAENELIPTHQLPKNAKHLEKYLLKVKQRMNFYKNLFFQEQIEMMNKKSKISEDAIPICSDIRTFNYDLLAKEQIKNGGRLFDAIMMDPPWQLSTSQPSRGVAIAYDSLSDDIIMKIPVEKLQTDGLIFIWAINAKYRYSCKLIESWGYKLVDEITWVKKTVNGKIAKGHGFYLQHAKESCLVGVKGNIEDKVVRNIASDVIFSERRGQSQKPEEIYEYIESILPNGFYLEIFGRRNNLRKNWVTIGNEL